MRARGESNREPGKLAIQRQTGLMDSLGLDLRNWSRRLNGQPRLQLPQAQIAGMGPAAASTEEAALLAGFVEEN